MFRWYQMTWIWPGAIMYHVYDQVPLVPSIWPLATRQVPPWHDSHVKCVAARCRHTRRHIRAPPPVILGMKWISRGAPSHQLDTKCPIISHISDTKYIRHNALVNKIFYNKYMFQKYKGHSAQCVHCQVGCPCIQKWPVSYTEAYVMEPYYAQLHLERQEDDGDICMPPQTRGDFSPNSMLSKFTADFSCCLNQLFHNSNWRQTFPPPYSCLTPKTRIAIAYVTNML